MKHILLKIYTKPIEWLSDLLYTVSSKLQNHLDNLWWKHPMYREWKKFRDWKRFK